MATTTRSHRVYRRPVVGHGIVVPFFMSFALTLALVSLGCSKKAEQCAGLTSDVTALEDKLTIDVSDDKNAEEKTRLLSSLGSALQSARANHGKRGALDSALADKAATYASAVAELETKTKELELFFREVAATTEPLAAMATASKAVEDAMYEVPLADRKRIGPKIMLLGGTPDDLEKIAAIVVEETKSGSEESQAKAKAYATAVRRKAAVLTKHGDVEAKLEALGKQSDGKRRAFASARDAMKRVIADVRQICGPVK